MIADVCYYVFCTGDEKADLKKLSSVEPLLEKHKSDRFDKVYRRYFESGVLYIHNDIYYPESNSSIEWLRSECKILVNADEKFIGVLL